MKNVYLCTWELWAGLHLNEYPHVSAETLKMDLSMEANPDAHKSLRFKL